MKSSQRICAHRYFVLHTAENLIKSEDQWADNRNNWLRLLARWYPSFLWLNSTCDCWFLFFAILFKASFIILLNDDEQWILWHKKQLLTTHGCIHIKKISLNFHHQWWWNHSEVISVKSRDTPQHGGEWWWEISQFSYHWCSTATVPQTLDNTEMQSHFPELKPCARRQFYDPAW